MNIEAQLMIQKARGFAFGAHAGLSQFRKFTYEPYFNHPRRVAEMAEAFGCDWEVICGCYLHDTVEDTSIAPNLIYEEFGGVVGRIVTGVTNVAYREGGKSRAVRFQLNLEHLEKQELDVKAVRLFDVFDNLRDAEKTDDSFANMLLAEKPRVLEVCREANYAVYDLCQKRLVEIRNHLLARGALK